MADIIRLLPDSVANQIAAGEVIQRPASVIKELIENAVDAGATEIQVIIKDAGRTLIQVIDNGKGMTETDARMAFERHATSKITRADDLFSLTTMGFRGEALPSICAVSHVELRTRTRDDSVGVRLCINASKVESQEPCVCEPGANFMVRDLFFNVPARRKFLKTDNVELANIMREFERLALVNNHIRLSIDTGSRKLSLLPGNFKQRITDLWKNNLNMELVKVDIDTPIIKINGYVSRPENARKRNPLQYFIVNGRNMKHPYFHQAVMSCFESLILPGMKPCYFLKFEVDPATIDVNIHPTKNEIKFENEREIWTILTSAVRAALGKSSVFSIDFNSDVLPIEPMQAGQKPQRPDLNIPDGYNPFESRPDTQPASAAPRAATPREAARQNTRPNPAWETLYSRFMDRNAQLPDTTTLNEHPTLPGTADSQSTICMQFARKYIITSSRDSLLIIDQHRAHLKVLYHQFLNATEGRPHPSQRIMFPETLHLDPAQQLAPEGLEEQLKHIGFTLSATSQGDWLIEGVPAELANTHPQDIIQSILESISDDTDNYGKEDSGETQIRRRIALIMARCGAIRRGDRLSENEMEHLVTQLMSLPEPALTPQGKKVYNALPLHKIETDLA